jgi:uncharacterized protein with ParB-like and HNH nuclease domain
VDTNLLPVEKRVTLVVERQVSVSRPMANETEIKSEKILVKDIFSTMWFCIPEYQRPYIWSRDEVNELLRDLAFAAKHKPNHQYFLGSFVFQSKKADSHNELEFDENDLLDGQQRMTTLLMLFACIRDMTQDKEAKKDCQNSIYQQGSQYRNIPERNRLVFAIREPVQDFVVKFVRTDGGTTREQELDDLANRGDDTSVRNMAQAILVIRGYFSDPENQISPEELLKFLLNKVLLIYVATQDLEDAFRLFTILNDRGVPLRNSDILKSLNLGALGDNRADKTRYAKLWEEAESELGEGFDRFLNYIRTVLVKEKARLGLLQEFEDKIYDPKEKDKSSGQRKPALLKKGKDTFQLVERYLKNYNTVLGGSNYDVTGGNFKFDNLVKVMLLGLPSTDWVPPLLRYFDKFGHTRLLEFLIKLDNKFSADWIVQRTPTDRIEDMNIIIKLIEEANSLDELLTDKGFLFDLDNFRTALEGAVYGRRFTRYLLLKLDYFYNDNAHRMVFETLSVEHVLPQTPEDSSQWRRDFTDEQREGMTDQLGNLVLISRVKNSSQGRLDYNLKKLNYFRQSIDTCPNSLRVLQQEKWTPIELTANHKIVINKIHHHYGIPLSQ